MQSIYGLHVRDRADCRLLIHVRLFILFCFFGHLLFPDFRLRMPDRALPIAR